MLLLTKIHAVFRFPECFFLNSFDYVYLFIFLLLSGCEACGILVPPPGIEPSPPAVELPTS